MLAPNTVLQKRYRVIRQLGHGGMGTVYEAIDERFNSFVALKETFVDTDEGREAFEREAKFLANLEHSAFPKVRDFFFEDYGQYLVMELIRGNDLAELLKLRESPFSPAKVVEWADQLLDALEDLHGYHPPIVHRDIKPSNLKLTPKGKIILLDFGIAKGAAGQMTHLETGSVGSFTPHYAPLEQSLKADQRWIDALSNINPTAVEQILQRGTDPTSDLYSLGATLYHLMTGEIPVDALLRAWAVWSGKPDRLQAANEINPQVPPAVAAVLTQAMALERSERPSTAVQMRRAFREATQSSIPSELPPTRLPPEIEERVRRQRAVEEERLRAEAEEAARHRREAEEATHRAEEERRRREEEEQQRRMAEEAARKRAEQEAARKLAAEQEVARRRAEEERLRIEEESRRRVEQEAAARRREEVHREQQSEREVEEARRRSAEREFKPIPPDIATLTTPPPKVALPDESVFWGDRSAGHSKGESAGSRTKSQSESRSKRLILIGVAAFVVIIAVNTMLWLRQTGGGGNQSTAERQAPVGQRANEAAREPATPKAPPGMIYVPGGEFMMGRDDGDAYERPAHKVTVKPFFIDLYEVTNEEYEKFIKATGRRAPPTWNDATYPAGAGHHPVTGVTWDDAKAYADWIGKRLPTEEEWEFAARSADERRYPWGNDWKPGFANAASARTAPSDVGSYKGTSPYGAFDMVGNAWEWTASKLGAYPGGKLPGNLNLSNDLKVIRGGSWESNEEQATTTYRRGWRARGEKDYSETGFRLAK